MGLREIKFRGKSTYDGKWVYGLLRRRDGLDHDIIEESNGMGHDVDPKTVGQYTGLQDKNVIEIYAGDIVKASLEKKGKFAITKVWYMSPVWKLADYTKGRLNGSFDMSDWGYGIEVDGLEVIGNVYENPNLIIKKSKCQ